MKIVKEIVSWILHIGVAFLLAMFINVFILQPTQVIGSSMENTLKDHDRLLISKLRHTLGKEPDYGDIVILDSRVDRSRTFWDDITDSIKYNAITQLFTGKKEEVFFVKRVIGKAGDVIEIKDDKVYRNGELLEEDYIKEPMVNSIPLKIVVPEGHVFVMGDNRNHSRDSRDLGPIPLTHIIGKSILKF